MCMTDTLMPHCDSIIHGKICYIHTTYEGEKTTMYVYIKMNTHALHWHTWEHNPLFICISAHAHMLTCRHTNSFTFAI